MRRVLLIVLAAMLMSSLVYAAPAAKAASKASAKNPVVVMETNLGSFELELYPDKAPLSVENFLTYVKSGFYNGTIFHRIIRTFMIQGGGFDKNVQQKATRAPIKNEAANGLKNTRGTLAMARTGVVDSATAQFFINVVDNAMLDHRSNDQAGFGYAVFGKVIKGMEVVDKIKDVPTGACGPFRGDCPQTQVVIQKAHVK